MNSRCSVFVAASLDGYIARSDGELDWLDEVNESVPVEEDCGFAEFLSTIDAIVMGRTTFDKVLTFGQWPYGDRPVIVLTRNPLEDPSALPVTVTASAETPSELLARLEKEGYRNVYVDGGKTIGAFLAEGAIESLTVTIVPILLGDGIPLFGRLPNDIRLTLSNSRIFDFGFVQLTYKVVSKSND